MNLSEFGKWAIAQKSVANPEENSFKGQCVSLIQQYLNKVFGKPFKAHGNAKDWATNYPKDYFIGLNAGVKLQKGDVLVYGSNYGHGYGHIGLIDANGNYLDQNGIRKLEVAYTNKPFSNYIKVLRPINQQALGLDDFNYKISQTYKTTVDLKVREGAGTNYRQKDRNELTVDGQKNALPGKKACLKTDTKVTCLEIKKENGNIWLRIPSGWIAGFYDNKYYVK